jgi:hypothetical protein
MYDVRHMTAPDVLGRVLAAARSPDDRHSPLYRWMWRHHDALSRQFAAHPPSWGALIQVFAEAGLFDRSGKPANAKTARQTWTRVVAAVARVRAARVKQERPATPPPGPGEIAYGVRKVEPPAPPTDAGERPAGGSLDDLLAEVRKGQEDWWPEPRSED